ncbi:MAG TPA: hypothetical protein VKS03_00155 [Thermoanaerobaculia bacterium]|nr:hypothetical protein [Thermoanaerobaculia bacterium]
MKRNRLLVIAVGLGALLLTGASTLLPARIREVSRLVEDVRGRRFDGPVPASEIDSTALRKFLKVKIADSFPAPPEETLSSLVVLGLIDKTPDLLERLLDFYTSQVIAFYDPEPHRFFVVRGGALDALEGAGGGDLSERLLFSHELTHALQDQALRLDRRFKSLRDDGDRALALQCLLEGEATLVMVRVALKELPGADAAAEETLAPLLSAGALEQANAPKGLPPFFVKQLFFPYVEGTAYVRRAVARGGWKEVDHLWSDPPLSTAEILHKDRRVVPAGDLLPPDPSRLAPPRARFLYSDTIGEWAIRFLLERSLPEAEASAAAEGWRGDRLAFFVAGGEYSYLWRIRFDSAGAAERFAAAFEKSGASRLNPPRILRSGTDVVVSLGFAELPALPGLPSISPPVPRG